MARSYADYMNAISPDELFEGLLGYGLFSDKLPNCLTSEIFYNYYVKNKPAFPNNTWHQYAIYLANKNDGNCRLLGIPTPMSYCNLCKVLSANWPRLQSYFANATSGQQHEVSRIHIRKIKHKKSLFEMNYPLWTHGDSPEDSLTVGANFKVHVDISQCFSSIYTHTIPWALVGKDESRSSRRKWFNKIDSRASVMKDGQTHGILIGPHASNVLSEIVLCSIDAKMIPKWNYVRHIDDYTCYAKSYADAQFFIRDLEKYLREYGLYLNTKKTSITNLPQPSNEEWVRELNMAFSVLNSLTMNYKTMESFWSKVIELYYQSDKNASVFAYAIKMLSKVRMSHNALSYYKKAVFTVALLLPYLVPFLGEFFLKCFKFTKVELIDFINLLYDKGLETDDYELLAFAVYYALLCNVGINNLRTESAINSNDCLFLLMSYLYCEKCHDKTGLLTLYNFAKGLPAGKSSEFDKLWLFAYEILDEADLAHEWKDMKKAGVTFVNRQW